jgi:hypothetical protein
MLIGHQSGTNGVAGLSFAVAVKALGLKRKKFYPPHILEDRRKANPKASNFYFEIEYDTATLRFLLERYLAAARQGIDISVDSPEVFWRALAAARATPQQRPPIETTAIPEPENGKVIDAVLP